MRSLLLFAVLSGIPALAQKATGAVDKDWLNQPLTLQLQQGGPLPFVPRHGMFQVLFIGDMSHPSTPLYFSLLNGISENFRHHPVPLTALVRGPMMMAQPANAATMPSLPFEVISYCEQPETPCSLLLNQQPVEKPTLVITDKSNRIRKVFSDLTDARGFDAVYQELNQLLKE